MASLILLGQADLSKGQQRVLHFLLANRTPRAPSQTLPIGYDTISRRCFLSRSGSRKVVGELCKKGLIRRLETIRGETQGSVYYLESSTPYATQSDTPKNDKSGTPYATQSDTHSCSSSQELLLQELILEEAFQDLNPRSLIPYLDRFDTPEDLQNFLDMANACVNTARDGRAKPIKNPHGFLFAQLRQGYINPPEGYKSRRVRAQELRNRHLEAELTTLKQLKEQEQELRFELFKAHLTEEDVRRLEQEAQTQVNPKIGMSAERQLEVHRDALLKQWFTRQEAGRQHT